MIEAVILDLDGVICSTDQYHYIAWKKLADDLNIPFNEQDNEKFRGVSRMDCLNILLEKCEQTYSQDQKEELANKKNEFYQQLLQQMGPNDLSLEVEETLYALKNKDIKLAIGSSSKNAMLILNQIGLVEHFDAICDGNRIHYSKPHPEVFIKAANSLKIDNKNCLVIEDALSGCIAAKSASMKVAAISSAYGNPFADYHLNSFKDILSIINKINK